MYIYFIQQGDDGPIKIGLALNPIDRIINLQRGSGYKLALLGVLEGDRVVEKGLHEKFSHLNVNYEWFLPGDDLKQFIAENAIQIDTPRLDNGRVVRALKKKPGKIKKKPGKNSSLYIERLLYEKEQSIEWLAREASISYSQTWSIVRNGISSGTRIGNIEKIAKALGVTVYDILNKHERQ